MRSLLETKKRRLSPSTLEIYGYWISSIESDALGEKPVGQLTDAHLRAWRARQELAAITIHKRCAWLNSCLKELGLECRVPVPPKGKHTRRPLAPSERKLLSEKLAIADERLRLALLLCWKCGLRRSEVCGLMHEDRAEGGIWVRRVVLIGKGRLSIRSKTKTPTSTNWVPLPQELKLLIGPPRSGFVLGQGGRPMNPRELYGDMRRLLKGTALESVPHLGLHALRRTYGQMLLESGADLVTAATAMRHEPMMLAREYARSRQDLMQDAVSRAFDDSSTQDSTHEPAC